MLICMLLATLSFVFFAFLYLGAGENISELVLQSGCERCEESAKKIGIEMELLAQEAKNRRGTDEKAYRKKAKQLQKKLKKNNKMLETYRKKKIAGLDLIPVAGYRLMQMLQWDVKNMYVKRLYEKCLQYREKREAMNETYYVLGNLMGYTMLGVCAFFLALGFGLSMDMGIRSLLIAVVSGILFFLIGYLPYDGVKQTVNRREEEIERDFPQLVSQMTLLIIAGMEVNRAWQISSRGGKGTLYEEMCRVNIDLEHNVSPIEAYSKFITRCSNKYATKLATAIMQNLTKGNAEIAKMFYQLNEESWSEHRHNARRMSEKVQSKLFLPTMLMFAGILIMVIIPMVSGFSSM